LIISDWYLIGSRDRKISCSRCFWGIRSLPRG